MHDMHDMNGGGGLFSGVRVIDCGTYVAGPAAATIMSDFGAEVIKIERPGGGDLWRLFSKLPGTAKSELDWCWILTSRNKKSVALDLGRPEGREALVRLVRTADVFLTNYQRTLLEKFRLTWEDLSPVNERLIYAHLTGYGDAGDDADDPAFDALAYWARSGLMMSVTCTDGSSSSLDVAVPSDHAWLLQARTHRARIQGHHVIAGERGLGERVRHPGEAVQCGLPRARRREASAQPADRGVPEPRWQNVSPHTDRSGQRVPAPVQGFRAGRTGHGRVIFDQRWPRSNRGGAICNPAIGVRIARPGAMADDFQKQRHQMGPAAQTRRRREGSPDAGRAGIHQDGPSRRRCPRDGEQPALCLRRGKAKTHRGGGGWRSHLR